MNTDILKQYVSARKALLQEKAQVEGRLQQINQALGQASATVTVAPEPVAPVPRRIRSPISMRAAAIRVTTGNPMTKPEIMAAIQKLGFHSSAKKPLQLLDNLLYGKNPRFKNDLGRFSPRLTATGATKARWTTMAAKPMKKRKISKAGRAKLSAAAKARWAKIKQAGGKTLKAE